MPLPISKRQFEQLGRRLAAVGDPAVDDVRLLQAALRAYGSALDEAVERATDVLGVPMTSRVKNTGTILEKLRRNNGRGLSTIQDLAGIRIVGHWSRLQQDEVAERIVREFSADDRPPRVIDRRADPRAGYRAVHVIVLTHGLPVEIQVRTAWQHEWAEVFEKFADALGRGIRYGQPPEPWLPDAGGWPVQLQEAAERTDAKTRDTVVMLIGLADRIDSLEREIGAVTDPVRASEQRADADESVRSALRAVSDVAEELIDARRRIRRTIASHDVR